MEESLAVCISDLRLSLDSCAPVILLGIAFCICDLITSFDVLVTALSLFLRPFSIFILSVTVFIPALAESLAICIGDFKLDTVSVGGAPVGTLSLLGTV